MKLLYNDTAALANLPREVVNEEHSERMGIISGVRRGFIGLFAFHPLRWIDYQNLKRNTLYLFSLLISLYQVPEASRNETFEEALDRLNISPEEIERQSKNFSFLTYFFLAISFVIFCYFLWLIQLGNIMGACMSLAIMVFSLSTAFRYDFWNYQIRVHKLGCSLREWLNDLVDRRLKIRKYLSKGKVE